MTGELETRVRAPCWRAMCLGALCAAAVAAVAAEGEAESAASGAGGSETETAAGESDAAASETESAATENAAADSKTKPAATENAAADSKTAAPPSPYAAELARVQNLLNAEVFGLAQEILETRGPPLQPTAAWLDWERQVWSIYRLRGRWSKLHWRARWLPPHFPAAMRREAKLQEIAALSEMRQGKAARAAIRAGLLADAPQAHKRELRRALITAYLADDLLIETRVAMEYFQRDYGPREPEWLLLRAGVLLRSGDADAAVNLLAPLNRPAARLLRLYARLLGNAVTPQQAATDARALLRAPHDQSLTRGILAVIAHAQSKNPGARADALEQYLLSPPARDAGGIYPQFTTADLLGAYRAFAGEQANAAGLLVGEEERWLEHALQLPADAHAVRAAWFAHLAAPAAAPQLRSRAVDAYIDALIAAKRTGLIARMFGEDAPLGRLRLGGAAGLRLSTDALERGDIELASEANASLSELPSDIERRDWLLHAGRIDIFAGRHRRGAVKLNEWIETFERLTPKQTDAVLQPVFDLQTVGRHDLALTLLRQVASRAPAGKYPRELAYWIAESHAGQGRHRDAADLFLHSALQKAGGLDRWGEASRFRAAEALTQAKLFDDARGLLEGMLARAVEPARRDTLRQKLQQLWLLQSSSQAAENE